MTESAMLSRIDALTKAVLHMAQTTGSRLTRAQMCERLGVCGKTLTERLRRGAIPSPGADGKWLLSEVLEWEANQKT